MLGQLHPRIGVHRVELKAAGEARTIIFVQGKTRALVNSISYRNIARPRLTLRCGIFLFSSQWLINVRMSFQDEERLDMPSGDMLLYDTAENSKCNG